MVCGAAFKQLSVRHLKEHGLDARSYRVKFGIPRIQPLSSKETTAMRKKIVQRSRPWEKAPTYIKAQERRNGGTAKSQKSRKQGAAFCRQPEFPATVFDPHGLRQLISTPSLPAHAAACPRHGVLTGSIARIGRGSMPNPENSTHSGACRVRFSRFGQDDLGAAFAAGSSEQQHTDGSHFQRIRRIGDRSGVVGRGRRGVCRVGARATPTR